MFWRFIMFTWVLLVSIPALCGGQDEDVLYYEDIQSQDLRDQFDQAPLISRTLTKSDWCKEVEVEDMEEIKEVGGRRYSKMSHLYTDIVTAQYILEPNSGDTGYRPLRPLLNCFSQSDPELVAMVRESHLRSHDSSRGYNLSESIQDILASYQSRPEDLSLEMAAEYFPPDLRDGFFVEAGAAGGEDDSHSLYFELERGWSGLLVEPQVTGLEYRNRRVSLASTCLATQPRPHYAHFANSTAVVDEERDLRSMGGIVPQEGPGTVTLQCLPLYTLLLALGNPTVHWFILDIEGAEFQVLQTIPWHLVDIEMISVETDMAGLVMPGSRQEIIEYMKSQGYHHRQHGVNSSFRSGSVKDDLFIREDVMRKYNIKSLSPSNTSNNNNNNINIQSDREEEL